VSPANLAPKHRRHFTLEELIRLTRAHWQLAFTERGAGPRKYRTKKWWQARLLEWAAIGRGLMPHSGVVAMGETRISDMILNDPRMHRLGNNPTARALYYEAWIWADREASEGMIDDVVLPGLCRGFERELQAVVDALVSVGLWERRNSGYYIVGFMESGKATRADRLAAARELREKRSRAGKAGADARWQRDGKPDGKSSSEIANGWQPSDGNWDGNVAAPLPDEEF
jgi:hypothetical protein